MQLITPKRPCAFRLVPCIGSVSCRGLHNPTFLTSPAVLSSPSRYAQSYHQNHLFRVAQSFWRVQSFHLANCFTISHTSHVRYRPLCHLFPRRRRHSSCYRSPYFRGCFYFQYCACCLHYSPGCNSPNYRRILFCLYCPNQSLDPNGKPTPRRTHCAQIFLSAHGCHCPGGFLTPNFRHYPRGHCYPRQYLKAYRSLHAPKTTKSKNM